MARNDVVLTFAVFLTVLVLSIGCSEPEPDPDSIFTGPYADWEVIIFGNVKIVFPPDHMHRAKIPGIAEGYVRSIDKICNWLQIEAPAETLVVYYYGGFFQAREITGLYYPYAKDSVIHFFQPSFLGVSLMQYLIPKWHAEEPQFGFMKHGLISYFDFSGQDYRRNTLLMRDAGELGSLLSLVEDSTADSDRERNISGPAAAFVDFLVSTAGLEALEYLYTADVPFDSAVQTGFGITVDSLETMWLSFAELHASPAPDTVSTGNEETL